MHADALHSCLTRLLPHVEAAHLAVTGGVAIGMCIANADGDTSRLAAAEDADFVAAELDAVRPTVTSDFLVLHFHLPQRGYPKSLVQLAVSPMVCPDRLCLPTSRHLPA